jgi:hypothetical protein
MAYRRTAAKKSATRARGADIGRQPSRLTVVMRENAARARLPRDCLSRSRGLSSSIPILAFRRLIDFGADVRSRGDARVRTYSERFPSVKKILIFIIPTLGLEIVRPLSACPPLPCRLFENFADEAGVRNAPRLGSGLHRVEQR